MVDTTGGMVAPLLSHSPGFTRHPYVEAPGGNVTDGPTGLAGGAVRGAPPAPAGGGLPAARLAQRGRRRPPGSLAAAQPRRPQRRGQPRRLADDAGGPGVPGPAARALLPA